MGKKNRDETEEERKERKRAKKEAKKKKAKTNDEEPSGSRPPMKVEHSSPSPTTAETAGREEHHHHNVDIKLEHSEQTVQHQLQPKPPHQTITLHDSEIPVAHDPEQLPAAAIVSSQNLNNGVGVTSSSTTATNPSAFSSTSKSVIGGVNAKRRTTTTLSAFQQKRLKFIVSLYPVALKDVMKHLKQSLRTMLLQYSVVIGGVMLSFDGLEIQKTGNNAGGWIVNELPHIHYMVEMDALIFAPSVGIKLLGVVNEFFPSHVGMLVHNFFNAMIPSEQLVASGYVFDGEARQWMLADQSQYAFGIGDEVEFTVDKLHECAGVISLEGSNPSIPPP